jgi:hypothetical protein
VKPIIAVVLLILAAWQVHDALQILQHQDSYKAIEIEAAQVWLWLTPLWVAIAVYLLYRTYRRG